MEMGYFIFNADGRNLTKALSYNKNGFYNYKKAYVFPSNMLPEIKNIFKSSKDKPIYKQAGFYNSETGESFPYGVKEYLWNNDELNKEELFLIELKSLMNRYSVSITEDFDWVWGKDGDEHQISDGFWFVSKNNDVLLKIDDELFSEGE